jgi:hypothetical protein
MPCARVIVGCAAIAPTTRSAVSALEVLNFIQKILS